MMIVASGMVTALGNNAAATCAALRAGVFGTQRGNLHDPESGESIACGRSAVPQWWEGPEMLAEMAAPAIEQCFDGLPDEARRRTPVLCILPPADRGQDDAALATIFVDGLEQRLERRLPSGSGVSRSGRSGLWAALARARQMMEHGHAERCVVVGADSYLRQGVVEEFTRRRRVHTPANSNGFVPGEAGCAVMVSLPRDAQGAGLHIVAMGAGQEPNTIDGEEPLRGEGLTTAIRQALASLGAEFSTADLWLNDQNGEHYKFKESMLARIRLERPRKLPRTRPLPVWHPIQYLGDIGCAIGPCMLGLLLAAHRKGYAPGPRTLVHVSEDGGGRGAMVLDWIEGVTR